MLFFLVSVKLSGESRMDSRTTSEQGIVDGSDNALLSLSGEHCSEKSQE